MWQARCFFLSTWHMVELIWEEGVSVEKMPPSDWSVGKQGFISDWCGSAQLTVEALPLGHTLYKKQADHTIGDKVVSSFSPWSLLQYFPGGSLSACPDFPQWCWNKLFLLQVAFGHGIYPSNINQWRIVFMFILYEYLHRQGININRKRKKEKNNRSIHIHGNMLDFRKKNLFNG